MKTHSEKEKKLDLALDKLKNLNLENPSLKRNLENLIQYVQVIQNITQKLVLKLQQVHLVKELQTLLALQLLKNY